jgi:FkbM family methyltransferase
MMLTSGVEQRMETVARMLWHPDPSQLWFQVAEIAGEQIYLRHGVTVSEGDVVLDVGANIGVAAVFFAAVRGAKLVHSFEPVPPVFEVLRRNVEPLAACQPHQLGLASTARRAKITYYPGATAMSGLYADPARDRELVRTVLLSRGLSAEDADAQLHGRYEPQTLDCELNTLSSFLTEASLDRVDLLKIDVERAELDVLGGISESDWPKIRQVVIEVHDEDGRGAQIDDLLHSRGFQTAWGQEEAMLATSIRMLYGTRR